MSEPLLHLLIVVDEFAELKSSEPEFMAELIRVARVGRSLGVHMILSTQKPAGAVDEQIESNTSFRICLRVQTPQDSQEMLGCPDAAGLRGMGRFLIKGQDRMTEAQSGWTGALLGGTGGERADCEAEVLDAQGRGLVSDGELYEFQTACPQESAQALCGRLSAEWREPGAPSIPVMPERVSASVLQARMLRRKQPLQLPVGVDRETLNTAFLSCEKRCVFRVAGEAAQLSSLLTEWAACLAPTADVVVLNADGIVRRTPGVRLVEPEGWAACAEELLRERLARMDTDDGTTLPDRITLVILTDIAQIWTRLQTDCCSNGQPAGPEALAPMLMKAKPSWHLRFILCGERAAFEQLSHQAWYSAVSKGDAVFLGEGLTSQYTFEYKGRPVGADAPFPWGYVITGGTAHSARLVATETEEAEEDEAW